MAPTWEERKQGLAAAHRRFVEAATAVPPEARERPGVFDEWSPKDLVAHVAGWNHEAARRLTYLRAHPDAPDRDYDTDAFNAAVVDSFSPDTWDKIMDALRTAQAAFLAALPTSPSDPHAADPRFTEWAEAQTAHIATHAAELLNASSFRTPPPSFRTE